MFFLTCCDRTIYRIFIPSLSRNWHWFCWGGLCFGIWSCSRFCQFKAARAFRIYTFWPCCWCWHAFLKKDASRFFQCVGGTSLDWTMWSIAALPFPASTLNPYSKQVLSLLAAGSRTNQAGFVLSKFRWQIHGWWWWMKNRDGNCAFLWFRGSAWRELDIGFAPRHCKF